MKILHINVNYIGSALHQTMIEHLVDFGIDNSVFVPTYDSSKSIVDWKSYVTVSECFNKWDRLVFFKKQNKIIKSIIDNYNMNEIDCIHAYTLFTDGNAAMELSKLYSIPYVVAVRNTDLNVFLKYMVHMRNKGVEILCNAKAIFFLSPKYMDLVLDKYIPSSLHDCIKSKCHIIPNGIDDFWHDSSLKLGRSKTIDTYLNDKLINCLYVGCIDKNKNVELSLKAITYLNSKGWNCSLTAIGKIVDNSVYKKLCKYSEFNYISPKKKEELISYYRDADVFLMPSHTETFGLVYAEAMSQGLPVIYTKGQGFDGQFKDGYIGYAVSSTDYKELADALIKIINNYGILSGNCLHGIEKFKWSKICSEYSNIYTDILLEK